MACQNIFSPSEKQGPIFLIMPMYRRTYRRKVIPLTRRTARVYRAYRRPRAWYRRRR